MANLPLTRDAPDAFPAYDEANQIIDEVLTAGFRAAAQGTDLRDAQVVPELSGALILSGTVLPTRSGALTDEEREELIQALERY